MAEDSQEVRVVLQYLYHRILVVPRIMVPEWDLSRRHNVSERCVTSGQPLLILRLLQTSQDLPAHYPSRVCRALVKRYWGVGVSTM